MLSASIDEEGGVNNSRVFVSQKLYLALLYVLLFCYLECTALRNIPTKNTALYVISTVITLTS